MSNLTIYKEERQSLNDVAFLKDVSNHTKIRDINNSYELQKQASIIFTVAANLLGIKEPISDINKRDISELVLSRFKNLSLDEVAYAFKMERYGLLGDRIGHFQLFNAQYVADVIDKYVKWKIEAKKLHAISSKTEQKETSDEEKQYWICRAVMRSLNEFTETDWVGDGAFNVYDILFERGYLPKDKEHEDEILKSAVECIQTEQVLLKKDGMTTTKKMNEILARIRNPKDSLVVIRYKELVVSQFFRKLLKDEKSLNEFKETFKVIGDYGGL